MARQAAEKFLHAQRSTFRQAGLVLGASVLLGVAFWLLDSILNWYFYRDYLRYLIFAPPQDFWQATLFSVPPYAAFVRISFFVLCIGSGLFTISILGRLIQTEEENRRQMLTFENMFDAVILTDPQDQVIDWNPAAERMFGFRKAEIIGQTVTAIHHPQESSGLQAVIRACAEQTGRWEGEMRFMRADGSLGYLNTTVVPVRAQNGAISAFLGVNREITRFKQTEQALTQSQQHFESLFDNMAEGVALHEILLGESGEPVNYRLVNLNPRYEQILGVKRADVLGKLATEVYGTPEAPFLEEFCAVGINGQPGRIEVYFAPMEKHFDISIAPFGELGFATIFTDITERKRNQQALIESEQKYHLLADNIRDVVLTIDVYGNLTYVSEVVRQFGGYDPQAELGKPIQNYFVNPQDYDRALEQIWLMIQDPRPQTIEFLYKPLDRPPFMVEVSATPMLKDETLNGIYCVMRDISERKAAERALQTSFQQIQDHLKRLTVLRDISMAVIARPDENWIAQAVVDRIVELDGVDAALWLDPCQTCAQLELRTQAGLNLDISAHLGICFDSPALQQAMRRNQAVFLGELAVADLPRELRRNGKHPFRTCAILPLSTHENINGALLILSRQPERFDAGWQDFLVSLASQTAVAFENATLLGNLQGAHRELSTAYEATIEGWSKALELRDKETKGHSERVTSLCLRLARQMGFPENEIVNFRRGVLLHDIGKMGIPDSILLKPGPLSDDEWVIMRQHPQYACQMLAGIDYLKPVIDIPYCHHEKWDGSGYPRGLAGEQIPLAARIFAIVDVWDALTTDRPYRPAWSSTAARDYLMKQAGKHFDPHIVPVFLRLLDQGWEESE